MAALKENLTEMEREEIPNAIEKCRTTKPGFKERRFT